MQRMQGLRPDEAGWGVLDDADDVETEWEEDDVDECEDLE